MKGIKKTVSSLIYKVVYSISSVRVTAWAFVLRGLNRDRKDQDTTHFSGSFWDWTEDEGAPARRLAHATASFGTYDIRTPPYARRGGRA